MARGTNSGEAGRMAEAIKVEAVKVAVGVGVGVLPESRDLRDPRLTQLPPPFPPHGALLCSPRRRPNSINGLRHFLRKNLEISVNAL